MCKLPAGTQQQAGSAATKALVLLKECAAQVTPEQPEDLRIIVEDLRAFMSSNLPPLMSEQFPIAIEALLVQYVKALTHEHPTESWETPSELMRRTFSEAPSNLLANEIQSACLRLPLDHEEKFWSLCRCQRSESSSALYRAWLLRHQPTEIEQIETAASRVREHVGEHAAALDLLRWAEVANICPNPAESIQWRALHWKVLRHVAEERASSPQRIAALHSGERSSAVDMATKQIHEHSRGGPPTTFQGYRSPMTGEEVSSAAKCTQPFHSTTTTSPSPTLTTPLVFLPLPPVCAL